MRGGCSNLEHSIDEKPADDTAGFALILVLWIIGLISVIVYAISWTTKTRVEITRNAIEGTFAEKISDAAFALLQLEMLNASSTANISSAETRPQARPTICTLSGALLIIEMENESGKVDLNTSNEEILSHLLRGVGATSDEAPRIATAVVEYRRVSSGQPSSVAVTNQPAETSTRPKQAPFDSILELDQVKGMRRDLFEAILPFVTVSAHLDYPRTELSPPGLSAALDGASASEVEGIVSRAKKSIPTAQNIGSLHIPGSVIVGSNYLFRAEVSSAGGGYFVREATVAFVTARTVPHVTEWRRGRERHRELLFKLRAQAATGLERSYPPCGVEL